MHKKLFLNALKINILKIQEIAVVSLVRKIRVLTFIFYNDKINCIYLSNSNNYKNLIES